MVEKSLSSCRIILVRPQVAGNLGATARVMRNFGLSDLCLVDPVADPGDPQARQLSTHGESILNQAHIVPDLVDALADCVVVVGTSARIGGSVRQQSVGTPRQIAPSIISALAAGPAALVFGPEPTGLTNDEVTHCHYLIHIPADPTYPALNLAQAVAVCLYEIRCAWLEVEGAISAIEPPAPFAMQERMFEQLRTALEEVHYLYGPNAEALMHGLRHLIGRAGPTAMEVDLLFGLARQLRWIAARAPRPMEGETSSSDSRR
jgi:tRNA/rRNA methyltransferase